MKRPYFNSDVDHGDSKVSNINGYFQIMDILMGRYQSAVARENYYVMHKTLEQLLSHVAFQFSVEEKKEMRDKLDALHSVLLRRTTSRCQQQQIVQQKKIRNKSKHLDEVFECIMERLKQTNMLFPTEKSDFRPKSAR